MRGTVTFSTAPGDEGKSAITKTVAAFGDMTPISKASTVKGKGRGKKGESISKATGDLKARLKNSKGVAKKRSVARNLK